MSNDEEEQEYYKNLITSLGSSVDSGGKITIGEDSALSKLNEKIRLFEKYMSKDDNQSKLDTLVLLQQLGLSELELIEKLSPGFLEQVKTFTSGFESVSYTDDNGFSTSISQVINFEKVITYKYNNAKNYWMYLSLDDRKSKSVYNSTKNEFKEYDPNEDKSSEIKTAAQNLTTLKSTTSEKLNLTMGSNLEDSISEYTINKYINEFTSFFNKEHNGLLSGKDVTYDKALEYLAKLCSENVSGEFLYRFLQDKKVQKCLVTLGVQKGSLATVTTADKPEEEQLTVEKVYLAMVAKINAYSQEAYTLMGDKERLEAQNAVNSTIAFMDAAGGGLNITYNENQGWMAVGAAGAIIPLEATKITWSHLAEKSTVEGVVNAIAKESIKSAEKEVAEAAAKVIDLEKKVQREGLNEILKNPSIKKEIQNSLLTINITDKDLEKLAKKVFSKDTINFDIKTYRKNLFSSPDIYLNKLIEHLEVDDLDILFKYKPDVLLEVNKKIAQISPSSLLQKDLDTATEAKKTAEQKLKDAQNNPISNISTEEVKKLEDGVKDAKTKLKGAKTKLKGKIQDIDHIGLDPKEDKDLIKKLKNLNKGKAVDLTSTDLDRIKKLKFYKDIKEDIDELEKATNALNRSTTTLESTKALQTNFKDGIESAIKKYEIPDDAIKNRKWLSKNKAKAFSTEYAKNIETISETGAIKLRDSAISKASKKGTQKTTEKTASTAAKALRLGGALSKVFMAFDCASAAIDGGTMGYGIAAWAVESNPQNFTNADGSYDTTRANVAKALGAASGACIGFAVGMWSSGVGAAINVATGGVAGTIVGGIAAGVGVLLGAASAVTCFTKWFK